MPNQAFRPSLQSKGHPKAIASFFKYHSMKCLKPLFIKTYQPRPEFVISGSSEAHTSDKPPEYCYRHQVNECNEGRNRSLQHGLLHNRAIATLFFYLSNTVFL
jgi:hypothetical protein